MRGFYTAQLAMLTAAATFVSAAALPVYQRTVLVEHLVRAEYMVRTHRWECTYSAINGAHDGPYAFKDGCPEVYEVMR